MHKQESREGPAASNHDIELNEWLDSLDYVIDNEGAGRALEVLGKVNMHAEDRGLSLPASRVTPYVNSISRDHQPPYPGDLALERRIKSLVRWNAMAMVVQGNRNTAGIGGHISTYASAATIWEVAFNHFLRADKDLVYFQGHASPGAYARAFLEGRLTEKHLENFRRELADGGGLSSYPHPWLMPEFWQFPTVSMGLGPIMAIYQARFFHYLVDRGLKEPSDAKVVAFLGDGEMDEPESLGAISLASREQLDNLIFVVNCNLQRLDGPVRGNGSIIQELEGVFSGAGWRVIKVIWGGEWDALFEKDKEGILIDTLSSLVDGELQKLSVESGEYIRDYLFGRDPRLSALVEGLSDEQLRRLSRGGHDPQKVYAAYEAAYAHKGSPVVILTCTVKGYGVGESGEGKNITHQQKKLNEDELREFRTRFEIPISDEDVAFAPLYKPADDSPEIEYVKSRREALGGYLPARRPRTDAIAPPDAALMDEFKQGTDGRPVSTTMAFVKLLTKLLADEQWGKYIVPIVSDEARTFGMEGLIRQVGIYAHSGQLYEPVDADNLLYYRESQDGQILEEGITEAGCMASFIAAGSAYSTHNIPMLPFFTFYSMFGLQRVGDLVWAAADTQSRGFLMGATSGRTTLNGEGFQHQDGHSHLTAMSIPSLMAYDPAFAYETAVIVRDGIRRMYQEQERVFYYITVGNENYSMPPMPEGVEDGITKGLYLFREPGDTPWVNLIGSGAIMNQVLNAQTLLAEQFGIPARVWSATSYKELRRDALEVERWNLLHPGDTPRVPYVTQCFSDAPAVTVAATDYVKAVPDMVARWIPGVFHPLGTDGYGRSETRQALRKFFEVDHRFIALAALSGLVRAGCLSPQAVQDAMNRLDIDPEKLNPMEA